MYPKLDLKKRDWREFSISHPRGLRQPTYIVSKILINKSHPQPATKKAPAGGKTIVTRMRIMSEALTVMLCVWVVERVLWSWGNDLACD